jgi:hypothetical protein
MKDAFWESDLTINTRGTIRAVQCVFKTRVCVWHETWLLRNQDTKRTGFLSRDYEEFYFSIS